MASPSIATGITPFSCSPDPTVVHVTANWKSTIYKTRYTIEHRQGLAAILGDPGLGKSTMLRYLYAHFSSLPQSQYLATFIPTPNFKSDFAALKKICGDLGLDPCRSMLAQQTAFENFLVDKYAAGVNVVVFLDEAQKLDASQLELVRTCLNFETGREKLVQFILAGNLDLRDRLLQKRSKALASRIFAPSMVNTMTLEDMVGMLRVRCDRESIRWPFSTAALQLLYQESGGVPRTILRLAEFAYAQMVDLGLAEISEAIMVTVAAELRIADGDVTV
jgi:type II secretory pathway predicted ATPase ExeA